MVQVPIAINFSERLRGADFISVSHSSDDILSCVYKQILDSEALGESKCICNQAVSQSA